MRDRRKEWVRLDPKRNKANDVRKTYKAKRIAKRMTEAYDI